MDQRLFKRVFWRFLRAIGLKQAAWDRQFKAGAWCYGPRSPDTLRRVAELCDGGMLVEFGAGEGTLPLALPRKSFCQYYGYDISGVAIGRAIERAKSAGLAGCSFEQLDMARWPGSSGVSLIVAEECLYYLAARETETFLRRSCASLLPGGKILIIVHSGKKHAKTLRICRRVCRVVDESIIGGRTFLTLAPKGNPSGPENSSRHLRTDGPSAVP